VLSRPIPSPAARMNRPFAAVAVAATPARNTRYTCYTRYNHYTCYTYYTCYTRVNSGVTGNVGPFLYPGCFSLCRSSQPPISSTS
jgi:hypothetical protein